MMQGKSPRSRVREPFEGRMANASSTGSLSNPLSSPAAVEAHSYSPCAAPARSKEKETEGLQP